VEQSGWGGGQDTSQGTTGVGLETARAVEPEGAYWSMGRGLRTRERFVDDLQQSCQAAKQILTLNASTSWVGKEYRPDKTRSSGNPNGTGHQATASEEKQ